MPISSRSPAKSPILPNHSIPPVGYTVEQLRDYIMRQLGYPTWAVELTPAQIYDCISDSLQRWSVSCPTRIYGTIALKSDTFKYLEGVDVGQGIVQVDFVEPNPVPTEIFYGNLIDPAPLFRTGLDEYDTFLRWRKTWMRVTSIRPDWLYDNLAKVLYIHNPLERFSVGIIALGNYEDTVNLPQHGASWVKEYALAKARYLWGDTMMKFSGAIPGPAGALQLDSGRRDKAETRIRELEEKLHGMQTGAPVSID